VFLQHHLCSTETNEEVCELNKTSATNVYEVIGVFGMKHYQCSLNYLGAQLFKLMAMTANCFPLNLKKLEPLIPMPMLQEPLHSTQSINRVSIILQSTDLTGTTESQKYSTFKKGKPQIY
jgi:hypothetical protein